MTANAGVPTSGRVLAGRYRLGSRRGAGLDIAIFEAFDEQLGRQVAVRLVHPDICATSGFADRFRSTMQKVASLTHPNLATVLDWGPAEWNGQVVQFVVTEDLAGGSLRDLLDRGRLLSPSQALVVGLDVCRALDAAHRHGIVHGDVRPANVLFGEDRRLRLVDLGLADLTGETLWAEPSSVSMERARYASPERARTMPLEAKSDVYSLALMLIEVVSGQVPFSGDSTVATLANRVDRLMPVTADLGPLAAVLERAGRPQPDTRYTAAEFGRAMVLAAEKLPRPAPLPLVSGGLFGDGNRDTTGPLRLGTIPSDITAPLSPPDLATWVPAPTVPPAGAGMSARTPAAGFSAVSAPDAVTRGAAPPAVAPAPQPTAQMPATPSPTATTTTPVESVRRNAGDATTVMAAVSGPPTQVMPTQAGPGGAVGAASSAGAVAATSSAAGAVPPPPPFDEELPLLRERRSRRKLLALIMVIVLAAGIGGAVAWYVNRDRSNLVPDLVGLDADAALNEVSSFGWDTTQTQEPSDEVDDGDVIRTEPGVGQRLDRGDDLMLVVSSGPAPRVLPEIAGLTIDEARAALDELGLVLQEGERVPDETVAPGIIVSWVVPAQPGLVAGGTALPETVIVARISAGPEAREVPDVVGLNVEEATAQLDALGLVVEQLEDEFSDEVPVGAIARQNPPGGAGLKVAKGSTVQIAVSKGQDLVVVPPLGGLTVAEVTTALTDAGLTLGEVKGDPAGMAVLAELDGMSLAAGVTLPRGTPVDVTFEVPPPPTTIPPETTVSPTTEAPPATEAPATTTV
jgi:serine/threonine-protein kinase